MISDRRGFLGALLALPLVGKVAPPKPEYVTVRQIWRDGECVAAKVGAGPWRVDGLEEHAPFTVRYSWYNAETGEESPMTPRENGYFVPKP